MVKNIRVEVVGSDVLCIGGGPAVFDRRDFQGQ